MRAIPERREARPPLPIRAPGLLRSRHVEWRSTVNHQPSTSLQSDDYAQGHLGEGSAESLNRNRERRANIGTVMKQNSYEMIIWWSAEDNAYLVDVPELPGCMAHGLRRQQAIKNAEEAIKFWIKTAKDDGLEIPQPRGRLVFA